MNDEQATMSDEARELLCAAMKFARAAEGVDAEKLRRCNEALAHKVDRLQKEVIDLTRAAEVDKSTLDMVVKSRDGLKKELAETEKRLAVALGSEARLQNGKLCDQIEKLKSELQEERKLRSSLQSGLAGYDGKMSKHQALIVELRRDLADCKSRNSGLAWKEEVLRARVGELEGELKERRRESVQAAQAMLELNKALDEERLAKHAAAGQFVSMSTEVQARRVEAEQWAKNEDGLKARCASLEDALRRLADDEEKLSVSAKLLRAKFDL